MRQLVAFLSLLTLSVSVSADVQSESGFFTPLPEHAQVPWQTGHFVAVLSLHPDHDSMYGHDIKVHNNVDPRYWLSDMNLSLSFSDDLNKIRDLDVPTLESVIENQWGPITEDVTYVIKGEVTSIEFGMMIEVHSMTVTIGDEITLEKKEGEGELFISHPDIAFLSSSSIASFAILNLKDLLRMREVSLE